MKRNVYLSCLLSLLTLQQSCKEDDKLMYVEEPRVYFFKHTTGAARDSVNYSFAFAANTVQSDTLDLRFRIMGFPKDYDRAIALQVQEGSTAHANYHYKIENLFIPAGSSDATASLILYRKAGLKDSTVYATFQIAANESFKPGYEDKDFGSALDRVTYKFSLTDKLSKPNNWDTYWFSLFGDYSNTKILFLTQLLNYTNWNSGGLFPQDSNNMKQKARYGIYEYEQEHGPMYDENGNRVIIP